LRASVRSGPAPGSSAGPWTWNPAGDELNTIGRVEDIQRIAYLQARIDLGEDGGGMTTTSDQVLLADIGGTNARFALLQRGEIGPVQHFRVADFATVTDALTAFFARHAGGAPAVDAVLGVAGTIENERCVFTNSPWVVDARELRQTFGFATAHLLNDFEAVAWSLPALQPNDLYSVGGARHPVPGAPMLAAGPGTGFGVGCFVPRKVAPIAIVTEAGHATLPATSEREERVIEQLRRRFGHVSIERLLSGAGLENLYQALGAVDGEAAPARDAAEISRTALDGSSGLSRAALDMFCSFLGTVAGNLALTFCAEGGVFIAGGIVPRFADHLAASSFRAQFEHKGRFEAYLRKIPTSIIVRPDASFVGLKAFHEHSAVERGRVG
jgi:glucokinase